MSKKNETTKAALIGEAIRLFAANGNKPLSRDFFRAHSPLKDKWSRRFKSFGEFMAAAGLPSGAKLARKAIDVERTLENHRLVIVALAARIKDLEKKMWRLTTNKTAIEEVINLGSNRLPVQ